MRQILNYGVEDWFDRPSRNGIELANSFGPAQRPNDYYSSAVPPADKHFDYGVCDWFKRPPRYGINLAKSFAPAEIPTAYFAPNTYPAYTETDKKNICVARFVLSPKSDRVVF